MPTQDYKPLAREIESYLGFKQKRLTTASRRAYEAPLRKLVLFYSNHQLSDFEPPAGTALVGCIMSRSLMKPSGPISLF